VEKKRATRDAGVKTPKNYKLRQQGGRALNRKTDGLKKDTRRGRNFPRAQRKIRSGRKRWVGGKGSLKTSNVLKACTLERGGGVGLVIDR